jgi:hypothetical protein
VIRSPSDVSAHEIRVEFLKLRGILGMARQYQIAKPRSKSLDLSLDRVRHVMGRPIRNVTVSPTRVAPCRSSAGIEKTRLRQEHEGFIGVSAVPCGTFGRLDRDIAAAQMQSSAGRAFRVPPWYWTGQCPIDLKDPGAVGKAAQPPNVSFGKAFCCNPDRLPRAHVEQHSGRRW